jgi:hypothetical protein
MILARKWLHIGRIRCVLFAPSSCPSRYKLVDRNSSSDLPHC